MKPKRLLKGELIMSTNLLEYKAIPENQTVALRHELLGINLKIRESQARIFELQNEIMKREIIKIVTAFLSKYSTDSGKTPPLDKLQMVAVLTNGADQFYSRRIFFDDQYNIYIYLRDERSKSEWFLVNERSIVE